MPETRTWRRGEEAPHGTRARYAYWKCRCGNCREAARVYFKRLRERRHTSGYVDETGTARRVQALVAYGWSFAALGRRLGTTDRYVQQLARAERSRGVWRRTADRIRVLYNELTALPPPAGSGATYARTVAARYGWVSPWAWDEAAIDDPTASPAGGEGPEDIDPLLVDEVTVHRIAAGHAPMSAATDAEQVEVVALMMRRGMSVRDIAEWTRSDRRTVERAQRKLGRHRTEQAAA